MRKYTGGFRKWSDVKAVLGDSCPPKPDELLFAGYHNDEYGIVILIYRNHNRYYWVEANNRLYIGFDSELIPEEFNLSSFIDYIKLKIVNLDYYNDAVFAKELLYLQRKLEKRVLDA